MAELTVQEKVANGFNALTAHFGPGWVNDINTDTLDVMYPDVCPVGQLFGSYPHGIDFLAEENPDMRPDNFGFDGPSSIIPALNAEWVRRILAARQA